MLCLRPECGQTHANDHQQRRQHERRQHESPVAQKVEQAFVQQTAHLTQVETKTRVKGQGVGFGGRLGVGVGGKGGARFGTGRGFGLPGR